MNISRNNYETYLIDYLDGKLNPVEISEVLLFLEQNPDIRAEMEGLEFSLCETDDDTPALDTSFLEKPVYPEVKKDYEPLLVAELEGDLTNAERISLEQAKQLYPELNDDARIFALTRLTSDAVVFPGKKELLRPVVIPLYKQTWLRVAAAALMIGFAGVSAIVFRISTPADQLATVTAPAHEKEDNKNVSHQPLADLVEQGQNARMIENTQVHDKITGNNTVPVAHTHLVEAVVARKTMAEVMMPKNAEIGNGELALSVPEMGPATYSYNKQSPLAQKPQPEFTDIKDLAIRQLEKQKDKLLGKTEDGKTPNLLDALNKATGDNVKIDKNEVGKIKRFEIAGLGFEWSQTR
jgi:hypothetical protein